MVFTRFLKIESQNITWREELPNAIYDEKGEITTHVDFEECPDREETRWYLMEASQNTLLRRKYKARHQAAKRHINTCTICSEAEKKWQRRQEENYEKITAALFNN
jgi:hypothetical protein